MIDRFHLSPRLGFRSFRCLLLSQLVAYFVLWNAPFSAVVFAASEEACAVYLQAPPKDRLSDLRETLTAMTEGGLNGLRRQRADRSQALALISASRQIVPSRRHTPSRDELSREFDSKIPRDLQWIEPIFVFTREHTNDFVQAIEVPVDLKRLRSELHSQLKGSGLELKDFDLVVEALADQQAVEAWVKQVSEKMFELMIAEGLHAPGALSAPEVREYFLDRVLAADAKENGFSIRADGLPHNLYSFSDKAFYSTISKGQLTIDWLGVDDIVGQVTAQVQSPHFARGHTLQISYLAATVPSFVEIYRSIGKLQNRNIIWFNLFDNVPSQNTPFWPGQWIKFYGPALGIRY